MIEEDADEIIRDALRIMVAIVDHRSQRPDPPKVYACHKPPALGRACRFGAKCEKDDPWHWFEANHPADHPLVGQPVRPQRPFSLQRQKLCAHWVRKGECAFGAMCRYSHLQSKQGAETKDESNHRRRDHLSKWKNRGKRNENRGTVLRRFLIDKFGIDGISSGTGVLDVAGGGTGGGGLAFQFMNYNNIQATIIDPRPPCARKAADRLMYAGGSRASPLHAQYNTDVTPVGEPPRLPRFILRLVEKSDAFVGKAERRDMFGKKEVTQMPSEEMSKTMREHSDPNLELCDPEEIQNTVMNCSVVCGLHPDGATEPIVDWAIRSGKPFAVVPCCVFWKKDANLQRLGVRLYEDYLDYLQGKLPPGEIQRETLGFDGRNVVLWWPGPTYCRPSASAAASVE